MLKELYTAALGMTPQQTRLETLANNIANANTAGFKRQSVFESHLISAEENLHSVRGDAEQEDPPSYTYTDFSAGKVERTGNTLDLAIENQKGYFVLSDDAGKQLYTRSGHFVVGKDGMMRTPDGLAVVGESGPILVSQTMILPDISGAERSIVVRVAENGEVFANEQQVGRIQLADVKNPQTLFRETGSHFSETEATDVEFLSVEDTTIRQGYIENSNVDIVGEMVEMIELQRLFETGQKVMTTNDGTLERAIEIGRFF